MGSESEEEEEREQFTRELFMVSQSIKVSESSRKLDPTDLLLKRRLAEDVQTREFSTHTGLVKMPLTNSSKLSVLIHLTEPLEETQESTGFALKSTIRES